MPATTSNQKALRPTTFETYTGQKHMMRPLKVMVKAAKKRDEAMGHCLFSGPPGLGKTTIAKVVANEMGSELHMVAAPSIGSRGELVSIFNRLEDNDILFIDEIHRLNIGVEENIYPAVEDYYLDLEVGSGRERRKTQMPLPTFTLLGATTRAGLVSSPLRTRFARIFRMKYYTAGELAGIATTSANKLGFELTGAAATAIAARGRGTPRTVNQHLRVLRDYVIVDEHMGETIDQEYVEDVMTQCGIDSKGLGTIEHLYLDALINKFDGGPAGLNSMCSVIDEEPDTVEDTVEQYLLQIGFIKKTSSGRTALPRAVEHMKEVNNGC